MSCWSERQKCRLSQFQIPSPQQTGSKEPVLYYLDYNISVWGSKVEVWFSGSYWGFHKTLLRTEHKDVVAEILRIGTHQADLPTNGHLTMISAMTKRAGSTVKVFLTYSQLASIVPHVHQEFVREGVIPTSLQTHKPSGWIAKQDQPNPSFVEIFIQDSKKTLTIEEPWILELFDAYWDHNEHRVKHPSDLIRGVLYNGDHRVPVEISRHEMMNQNPKLYEFLQPHMHVALV